ncbi:MAG: amino acid ABC transporter ATP-binding protein [Actinomycetota bacterium]|nr:amino acid ABC transporter ATP-binding protein [Actinomycetota bacterium]
MKLEMRKVVKSFGPRSVLSGLDFDVAAGEVVSFIGASGSGKTTLLRCVNLLEPIDDGAIFLDGDEISQIGRDPNPIRRRIGIVFQSFNLFPHMSVRQNITLALTRVLEKSADEATEVAKNLLARFGLAEKLDAYPDQLSGGQQQRVAIVRALAMSPELLLLDEITSALDPELVGEVLDVVRELKGSGITMLIATHEMNFAQEISDRVCFLDGGRIAEQGPPRQIFSQPRDERTKQFLRRVQALGKT